MQFSSHASIHVIGKESKSDWDTKASHPLQSWAWGECKEKLGTEIVRYAVFEKDSLTAPFLTTLHRLPLTGYVLGYTPKSILPNDDLLKSLLPDLRKRRIISIQLEPDVQLRQGQLMPHILVSSPRPLFTKYTFILHLTKTDEELLSAMHSKTRYNIRVAQKHGVKVREDNSPQAFTQYIELMKQTVKRQGYYAHNPKYHQTVWDTMHKAGIAKLITAEYQNTILAAWIIFAWNKTLYYPYGASARVHKNVMAPYLLLWEIARWGRKNGYTSFDLWGSLGNTADIHDPWYGFHRFKQGFSPELVEYVGSYDLIASPFAYRGFVYANTLRWKALMLQTKIRSFPAFR